MGEMTCAPDTDVGRERGMNNLVGKAIFAKVRACRSPWFGLLGNRASYGNSSRG